MRYPRRRPDASGFTLIEAMTALVVLLFALLGAMSGLIAAGQTVRTGQLQQFEAALLEAKAQRLLLANKVVGPYALSTLQTTATATSAFLITYGNLPENIPIGSIPTPWVMDPTPSSAGDLGSGALFKISPNGQLTQDPTVITSCKDTAVPAGDFCREIAIAPGPPPQKSTPTQANALALPGGTSSYTAWIRVTRIATPGTAPPASSSVVYRTGFEQ